MQDRCFFLDLEFYEKSQTKHTPYIILDHGPVSKSLQSGHACLDKLEPIIVRVAQHPVRAEELERDPVKVVHSTQFALKS